MTDRGWGPGPWDTEPDSEAWRSHEIDCFIYRADGGHLCGYVGVREGHPWYHRSPFMVHAHVHGGLNYARHSLPPREPPGLWILGFDCAHLGSGDLMPELAAYAAHVSANCQYRPWSYVHAEVERLAEQAAMVLN